MFGTRKNDKTDKNMIINQYFYLHVTGHSNAIQRLVPCCKCLKEACNKGDVVRLDDVEKACKVFPLSQLILNATVEQRQKIQCSDEYVCTLR